MSQSLYSDLSVHLFKNYIYHTNRHIVKGLTSQFVHYLWAQYIWGLQLFTFPTVNCPCKLFHILASECSILFFFLHPFFCNFFHLWLRKGQETHCNRWKKGGMKCILDTLTSLVAKTRDTGSFSVPILPLPTQVCQAPFPWLHFMVALNCNCFSYSRFPI